MKDFQYITSSHPAYIENLYNDFVKNPESVDVEMRHFFEEYKTLENKTVVVEEFGDKTMALKVIEEAIESYKKNYGANKPNLIGQ